jgi:hypothetical protein
MSKEPRLTQKGKKNRIKDVPEQPYEEVTMINIVEKSLNNSKWYKYFNKM